MQHVPLFFTTAVMLALIVIVCLTAIKSIGTNANSTFTKVATQLQ